MGRISRYRRYVIDVNGTGFTLFVGVRWGVRCFGEFGASEPARTMKIGRRVRDLHKLT